jgi:hypothetical protein
MTGIEMDKREIVVQFPVMDKILFSLPKCADRLCRFTHSPAWIKRQRRDTDKSPNSVEDRDE